MTIMHQLTHSSRDLRLSQSRLEASTLPAKNTIATSVCSCSVIIALILNLLYILVARYLNYYYHVIYSI